jgi:cell shape-determining protein MreC
MKTNKHKRLKRKIDKLLEQNAKYQAANVCVNNSEEEKKKINDYCNKNFIDPIESIDTDWFGIIKKQSE